MAALKDACAAAKYSFFGLGDGGARRVLKRFKESIPPSLGDSTPHGATPIWVGVCALRRIVSFIAGRTRWFEKERWASFW